MKFLSICSGIEAASVAWLPLGFECIGHSEIEPFPCRVLEHHYPGVKNYGDLTKWREWNVPEKPDIIVGGTPCQDFSIAGKREEGERADLTHQFIELCGELRPEWVVWENVPGVLSMDEGRTFARILRGFSQRGYGWAYRALDAQYFGVPQRRRRIFLVGHSSGDPRCAGEILFEQEGLRRDIKKSGEEGERDSEDIKRITNSGDKSLCLNAHGHGRLDYESETFIFEPRSHGVPRIYNNGKSPTLNTAQQGQRQPCIAFTQNDAGRDATKNVSPTLRSGARQCVAEFTAKAGVKSGSTHFAIEQAPTIKAGQTTEVRGTDGKIYWVRRLTPTEALRLQGFPDSYLKDVPGYSDTQAYRAIGNSKAVSVVRWIGERIKNEHDKRRG